MNAPINDLSAASSPPAWNQARSRAEPESLGGFPQALSEVEGHYANHRSGWAGYALRPRLALALLLLAFIGAAGAANTFADPAAPQSPGSGKIDVNSTDARIAPPYSTITDTTGPNARLYRYLGDPVAPPPSLDPAYSPAGLEEAMLLAAKKAGMGLKVLFVDQSEFPFLVVVSYTGGDWENLKKQLDAMDKYSYGGSVADSRVGVFNITPQRAIPGEVRLAARRRTRLRASMLYRELIPDDRH